MKLKAYRKHLVIPDSQVKPGVDLAYLNWIGYYIVDKQPDVVIHLGDFADMESLSSYDKGKKSFEGRRYKKDVESVNKGLFYLLQPLWDYQQFLKKNKKKVYKPRLVMCLGNHEERIDRAIEHDAILEGTISTKDLGYEDAGFEVHPFLEVAEIDGIAYSHYFPRGPNGRIMQTHRGSPSAKAQVMREGRSCTAGHLQGVDYAVHMTGVGIRQGLIAGSCYPYDFDYLSPQGHDYWRGVIMKHEVHEGRYDPMFVSLDYLERRYG